MSKDVDFGKMAKTAADVNMFVGIFFFLMSILSKIYSKWGLIFWIPHLIFAIYNVRKQTDKYNSRYNR